jgi:hypothetical protein
VVRSDRCETKDQSLGESVTTDCRSWVVAYEDPLRLPTEFDAGSDTFVAPLGARSQVARAVLFPMDGGDAGTRGTKRRCSYRLWREVRVSSPATTHERQSVRLGPITATDA